MAIGGDGQDERKAFIMWGEKQGLECDQNLVTISNITSEPLVFDYNNDYVSDLLTVDKDGERKVYVFSKDRGTYSEASLTGSEKSRLKAEHGNSFVDVTGDGRADLLLTTVTGLELHAGEEEGLEYSCTVPWPDMNGCNVDHCVGQPAFLDFSLTGSLDMVLPVCFDIKCSNSSLYLIPVSELAACPQTWTWRPMSLDLTPDRRFMPTNSEKSPLSLMTPRVGDVDLDGFPDLLMTVYNVSSGPDGAGEVELLLNVPCEGMTGCHQSDQHYYWRQFQLQPGYTAGVGPAVTGAFFDLYEDGRMDLMVVHQEEDNYKVTAYVNTTQDSDAYFMKVIVLTGACYHDCPHDPEYVPYGTNTGGQLISYRSQRPGQETFDSYQSVAVQLPQSSHFALGLPYTIFGLGMAPNFVDSLSVNISAESHEWPQIIPNSQLYVIPYPSDKPDSWDVKLIITASKNILFTGLALVGTCALCTVIIVLLHMRDRRSDHRAKLQEASRFHFDAM